MMENLKSVVGDTKISPNCLTPKFNRPKIAAVRSYPVGFTQFDNVVLGKKLVYGENNVISCGDQAMEVEPVVVCERKAGSTLGSEISGDQKDAEQIAQIGSVDECGSTRSKVVDTLKWNFQVDNEACLDLVNEIKTRECDMIKPKRRKVSSLRDFPKDLKSYDVVDKKSPEHCTRRCSNVETNDEFHEHLKVDFNLVDPVVDALSCRDELGKQAPVVTVELQAVLQSDLYMELHDEAVKNEETVEFKCGEDDNNSYSMVENVSLVKTASEDAENPHLLNEPCSLVPCRFPKRRKVSAVRDFPDALKILKAHNKTSEKNLKHRAANELAGENETACDSQDDVEHIETQIESQENSAPTEKGLSRNVMILHTSTKEDTVNFGANSVYKQISGGPDGTGADKQELANCGANSTPLSTQSSLEVTNSNKRIGRKEIGVKCVNKTIVEDLMATPRCPNMPTQRYRSDTKTNQDKLKGKDKVLKRKQNEGSMPITVVLALMAPTNTLTRKTNSKASYRK